MKYILNYNDEAIEIYLNVENEADADIICDKIINSQIVCYKSERQYKEDKED